MKKQHPRGQALVEFALVSLAFSLCLVIIVMVGMAIFVSDSVTNVAKIGTRYAIVRGSSCQIGMVGCPLGPTTISQRCPKAGTIASSSIVSYLCGQLVPAIAPHVTVSVSWPDSSNAAGHPVRIVLVYPYQLLFFPRVVPLTGVSQMLIAR